MNRFLLLPVVVVTLASLTACGGADTDAASAGASTAASAGAARASGGADADMAEITDRRLTMNDVERYFQAQRNMYEALRRNPALARQLEESETGADQISLDDIEARYEAVPEVRAAIEAAGLEVRDFGVIVFTLAQAGVAHATVQMGADRDSVLARTGVQPANLDFVRDNWARLQQMQAEVAALAPPDADEEVEEDAGDF